VLPDFERMRSRWRLSEAWKDTIAAEEREFLESLPQRFAEMACIAASSDAQADRA
jgi:hypothetical protein